MGRKLKIGEQSCICNPDLKLTAVKGTHVHSLYAKYEVNKNIWFLKIKIKENTLFCGFDF